MRPSSLDWPSCGSCHTLAHCIVLSDAALVIASDSPAGVLQPLSSKPVGGGGMHCVDTGTGQVAAAAMGGALFIQPSIQILGAAWQHCLGHREVETEPSSTIAVPSLS